MPESKIIVQFLGSGDAFGSGGRLQTCLYVEADTFLIPEMQLNSKQTRPP